MLFGGPILIKRHSNVDLFGILVLLGPRQMSALELNRYTQMGCWRYISTYVQASLSVRSEVTGDVRALDWCPGPIVLPL